MKLFATLNCISHRNIVLLAHSLPNLQKNLPCAKHNLIIVFVLLIFFTRCYFVVLLRFLGYKELETM